MAFPATFVDLQNDVIQTLRLDASADLARVKDWINMVYAEACVETEFVQSFATMTLTSGTATYSMDSSVIRIKQMYCTPVGGTQGRPLEPVSLEQMLEWSWANANAQQSGGGVRYYAFFGSADIQFFPTPSAADVITAYYVKLPTALSADSDTPVLPEPYASNLLFEGACYQGGLFLKDPDAQIFKQDFATDLARLRAHLRRREGAMTRQFRETKQTPFRPHDPSTDWATSAL